MSELESKDIIGSLTNELRRGTIIIGVMSQLEEPQYGYSLVTIMENKGIEVDAGTLYPLLRRLEKQGLLESKWDTDEARPRKYYMLSPLGKEVYGELCREWAKIVTGLSSLIDRQ